MTAANQPAMLPIDTVLPDLLAALRQHPTVLLSAAPGAGKTTRVPLALLQEPWLARKRIIMLEPRRLAARNAARFMAQQLGEAVGEQVGYRIRLDNKVSARTRIEVVTEGILTRMLQDDPQLTDVGLIIFDEFHERHLASDLALALSLQAQALLRDDLKLLIMSATLDSDALSRALNAPFIASAGRSFTVDIQYRPLPNANSQLIEHCARVIHEALQQPGDMLVFLPGLREINQLQQHLNQHLEQQALNTILVLPLHGQLNDAEQKAALTPAPNGQRKIILATNIAESSLTIDGVRIVIDSGLERRNEFHVSSGLNELKTRSISQASATQRAGRAGRQAAGIAYRLWPESTHERLDAHIRAEIADADLTPLLLELLQWGAAPEELFWLTPPPKTSLNKAAELLAQLGLVDANGHLTSHGKDCAALGIEPRWAHALLMANEYGQGRLAADVIAFMQEWPAAKRDSDDLQRLLTGAKNHSLWAARVAPLAKKLQQALPAIKSNSHWDNQDALALIIALACPDRIAKRRDAHGATSDRFLLSNGRGAELIPQSDLLNADWLACADFSIGSSTRIRLAAELSASALIQLETLAPQLFSHSTQIGFQNNGQFMAQQQQKLGAISVSSKALPSLTAEQWQQAWHSYVQEQGLGCLNWNDNAQQLRARLQLAHQHLDPSTWPAMDDQALLASIDVWLLPFLSSARHVRDLEKVDIEQALLSLLSWEQQQQLNSLVPTHFQVPSGSSIALNYLETPPVLAVKLQEMFGYEGKPAILNGHITLLIHLLSPARQPLQVTADLPHFWRNTYADVRKDMRGRYPKHPWPEDPLSAEATRLTKAALARRHDN